MRALIAGDKCYAGRNEGGRRITMGRPKVSQVPSSIQYTGFQKTYLIF